MRLEQLIDRAAISQYAAFLKRQNVPAATIERKLAALKKFSAWRNPYHSEPAQTISLSQQPALSLSAARPKTIRGFYEAYSQSRISSYLHLSILVLFAAALAVFGYNQIFKQAQIGQAYPQAPNPKTPNRYLSFQARLTDSSDNPITTPTDVRFMIYNDATATGAAALWEELRYVDPDSDGIFSVTLGTEQVISSTVFTENTNLWLGVTVETDAEATPRQRIATVGYALNAETLQGFPPSASPSANQIPVITQEGDLVLAAANPMVYSSSGTFGIKGQALAVTTDTGTNGSITIQPDGTGQLLMTGSTTNTNFIRATDANLTSGHLISGYVGNNTATGDLLNLSSGSVETEKFTVDQAGNVALAGDLTISGGNITSAVTADSTLTVTGTLTANATLDANGLFTLGDGGDTGAIDTSDWDINTTGDMTGIGAITSNGDFSTTGNVLIDNQADLRLYEGDAGGSNYTGFQAPATLASDVLYTLPSADAASSGYILSSNASGTLSWIDPGAASAGTVYWSQSSGALYPKNSTVDLLIGGQATGSAKFAFLNVDSGIPTASIAGQIALSGGNRNIQTTAANSLILGGDTTGDVLIQPNGDTGDYFKFYSDATNLTLSTTDASNLTLDPAGSLITNRTLDANGQADIGDGGDAITLNGSSITLTGFNTCTALETNGSGLLQCGVDDVGGGDGLWRSASGAISPVNDTFDILIGSNATTSAKFAFLNVNSGTPIASISANSGNIASYLTGDGTLATINRQTLTIGNSTTYNTTGNVLINPNGTGNVGIGDTTPASMLTVGNGDLFQVNSSGIIAAIDGVAHTIDDVGGNLTLTSSSNTVAIADGLSVSGTLNANGIAAIGDGGDAITLNGSSITLTGFNTCTALETNGAGVLACGSDGGASMWQENSAAISPINNTWDVLIGATATTSAKFGFLNVNSGTPVASISANSGSIATYLTGDGTLATTNRNTLTIGNSVSYDTTGNVLINPNGTGYVGIGTTTPFNRLNVSGADGGGNIARFNNLLISTAANNAGSGIGIFGNAAATGMGLFNYNGPIIFSTAAGTSPTEKVRIDSSGNLGIGTTAPDARLEINHATGDNLRLTYNDSNGSAAAYTDFSLAIDGDLTIDSAGGDINLAVGDNFSLSGTLNANGIAAIGDGGDAITLNGSSITLTGFNTCTALETNGAGVLQCGSDGGGGGMWQENAAAISPINNTWDVLIGNTASTSAKFAFLNVDSGIPVASISANSANNASYLTGSGNLGTTNAQTLTLGGAKTGDVLIQPNQDTVNYFKFNSNAVDLTLSTTDGSSLYLTPAGTLNLNSTGDMTLDSSTDIVLDADGADVILKDNGAEYAKLTNSSTDLILDPTGGGVLIGTGTPVALDMAGDDLFVTDDLEIFGGVATMSAATNKISGKNLTIAGTEMTTLNIGDADTGIINFYTGANKLTSNGDLILQGSATATVFYDASSVSYYLDPAATATSLSIDGNIVSNGAFSISSNGNNDITINAGAGTVIIGAGSGKLNAGTVDPPYTINGEKFATYMPGMTGVKEETTGTIKIDSLTAGGGYAATIDFKNLDAASDLWLFSKTTDIKKHIADLVVLISAEGNARTWYEVDEKNYKLTVHASRPTTVSYRLTAPRFDSATWANRRNDESLGFVIDDNNSWPAATETAPENSSLTNSIAEIFDQISGSIASLREVKTDIISPLSGNNIFITGNVEISGDASISGTLTADKIQSTTIDTLREKIETLASSYRQETATAAAETDPRFQAWLDVFAANPATPSSEFADINHIDVQSGFFSEYLAVLGQAVMTDLQVTGTVSLTSLTSPTGTIDLAGNLVIDGDLTVKGNVILLGDLTAPTASFSSLIAKNFEAETAKINELTTNQLIIALPAEATPSALTAGQDATNSAAVRTNATAGKGTLPAGVTEYTIYNSGVGGGSLVYVSPVTDPQNQVLYVKSKTAGEKFVVAINQPLPVDLEFNWWIIKLE